MSMYYMIIWSNAIYFTMLFNCYNNARVESLCVRLNRSVQKRECAKITQFYHMNTAPSWIRVTQLNREEVQKNINEILRKKDFTKMHSTARDAGILNKN